MYFPKIRQKIYKIQQLKYIFVIIKQMVSNKSSKSTNKKIGKLLDFCSLKTMLITICSLVLIGILSKIMKSIFVCSTNHKKHKPFFYYTDSCDFSKQQKYIIRDAELSKSFHWINCSEYPNECNHISSVPQFIKKNGETLKGVQSGNQLFKFL